MKYALVVTLLALVLCPQTFAENPPKLVRIHTKDISVLKRVSAMGADIAGSGYNWMDIVVKDKDMALTKAIKGVRQEVILENVHAPYEAFRNRENLGIYHTVAEVEAEVLQVAAEFPHIVKHEVMGTTYEGRTIHGLKITDNPLQDEEGEAPIFFMGSVHSREWIANEVPMALIHHLVNNYGQDERVTRLVNEREIWIVPAVNLDGMHWSQTEYKMWRKSRRDNGDGTFGVDCNRNWGYNWGGPGASASTSSDTYRGPHAFSEPCIAAMRDLVKREKFVACCDYHSYSELVLWPWGHKYDDPEDVEVISKHGKAMAKIMGGYVPEQASDLYPCSGVSADWFYGEMGMLCYTYELGKQFVPYESDVPEITRRGVEAALYFLDACSEPFPMLLHTPQEATIDVEGPHTITAKFNRRHFENFDVLGIDVLFHGEDGIDRFAMTGDENEIYKASLPGTGYGQKQYQIEVRGGDGSVTLFPESGNYSFQVVDTLYLLVDDDKTAAHETYYAEALDELGLAYRTWNTKTKGTPTVENMLGASAVLWFCGSDSSTTLQSEEQKVVKAYLEQGGELLLFGQDIGYDIKSDPFYGDVLRSEYKNDKSGLTELQGVEGTFLAGMEFSIARGDDNVYQSYPEEIEPIGEAFQLLHYVGGEKPLGGAVAWEGATGRFAYFGFGLEGIKTAAARKTVMEKAIAWVDTPAVSTMTRATTLGKLARKGSLAARRALDSLWTTLPERMARTNSSVLDKMSEVPSVEPIVHIRFRSAALRAKAMKAQ